VPLVPLIRCAHVLRFFLQAVATRADGGIRSPLSNEDIFTTPTGAPPSPRPPINVGGGGALPPPAAGPPTLTSALAWGPTTGQAAATGPAGVTFQEWEFTATPKGGGPAVKATAPAPEVRFYGLSPNTEVRPWCCLAVHAKRLLPPPLTLLPHAGALQPVAASYCSSRACLPLACMHADPPQPGLPSLSPAQTNHSVPSRCSPANKVQSAASLHHARSTW